jgi:hypothetical protein
MFLNLREHFDLIEECQEDVSRTPQQCSPISLLEANVVPKKLHTSLILHACIRRGEDTS